MVKILSFDIGIKNLAYCLLENTDINVDSSILDWGIIDLINDTPLIPNTDKTKNKDNTCVCSFIQKNKKICGKTGYCHYKENGDILCKTHRYNKYYIISINII